MSRLYVLSASTRPTSSGRPLTQWVAELASARPEFEVTTVDLGEVALPFLDEPEYPSTGRYAHPHTRAWSETMSAADAYVFVMPMYNGGFTAPLKNAIDSLYAEWQDKPVGLISYSAGPSGGAPAIEMLRPVLGRVGLRVAEPTLSVPGIEGLVEQGAFHATPEHTAGADAVLDEVAALVTAGASVRAGV
ncbi:NAD(P)H-dependent oxidoreductase [Streptomyces sp. NBC_00237]|uniref:NADPH-dependent FMN reductase n=1 Tax=Streptomyces sp. NBC_00237 TaxID=2975687 RepID=UPI002254E6A5|nr:NAD(P)H-dependent oxidoreductase [Streptomyces sp. NBC_00237]MCX5204096.1 NAD(P)H-dependent oxidoreductase [Streptomyces sp. NBC_00237]